MNEIGSGYFASLGIPLMTGRDFDDRDTTAGAKVAIVNEEFARYFFGGANPIGRRFVPGTGNVVPDTEIVGMVRNSHYAAVREKQPRVYYVPWRRQKNTGSLNFYVRCALPPGEFINRWCSHAPTHHFALGVGHRRAAVTKVAELMLFPWGSV